MVFLPCCIMFCCRMDRKKSCCFSVAPAVAPLPVVVAKKVTVAPLLWQLPRCSRVLPQGFAPGFSPSGLPHCSRWSGTQGFSLCKVWAHLIFRSILLFGVDAGIIFLCNIDESTSGLFKLFAMMIKQA